MYMTELVRGHEEIQVYVEHPVDDCIIVVKGEDVGEGVQPLAVEQDIICYYDNDDSNYSDDSKHDDHDKGEFYSFYNSDDVFVNAQTFNNEDEPIEVDAKQVYARRVGEGPVIEEVNIEKKVKKQHNIKLRDIQDAVHEKYTLNISVGKASRTRDKAREYVDGAYTQQNN